MKVRKITRRLLRTWRKIHKDHRDATRIKDSLIAVQRQRLMDAVAEIERLIWLLDKERAHDGHWVVVLECGQNTVFHFEGRRAKDLALTAYNNNLMPDKVTTVAKVYASSGDYFKAGKSVIGMEIQNGSVSPISRELENLSYKPMKEIGNGPT